ncbi:MAG: DUF962 domain-containing protein [Alphaproteobacteria bacterium]|nr:DUF962 domain-containing protein [Alphaproteobacteria bacterium]
MTERETSALTSYRAFWPHYLSEHAKSQTRAIHIAGTILASAAVLTLIVTGKAWLVPVALLAGYGPAWTAHFFVEHNRPATFRYPLWSLTADYHMTALWLLGHLGPELDKAGVSRSARLSP